MSFVSLTPLLVSAVLAQAPAAATPTSPSAAAVQPPAQAVGQALSGDRLTYYQRGLPAMRSVVSGKIPDEMLSPVDSGNDSYFEALDKDGKRCGYLRDFTGPVSGADACPCNPLRLTLVFDANAQFVTLISPEPLQKYGHMPMTPDEQKRLIAIAKDPPKALLAVPRVEAMVDATTGATRLPLKDVVVHQAGLSTRRIVGLVRDTQAILQGAPATRDRQRLRALMAAPLTDSERCQKLVELMPTCESEDMREQAYRLLGRSYASVMARGAASTSAVEEALLNPPVPREHAGALLVDVCGQLAERNLAAPLVARCIASLTGPKALAAPSADVAHLQGTALYNANELVQAEVYLRAAARTYRPMNDPMLHLHLAQAQAAAGKSSDACTTARTLNRLHPLLPGAKDALKSCVTPAKNIDVVLADIHAEARAKLLAKPAKANGAAPELRLLDDAGKPATLSFAAPEQITVAVFFATWCPHCRAELPRVKAFVASLSEAERKRVRVVGVRTAVEREQEPYESFTAAFTPNFPIYTDSNMSLSFVQFATYAGISAGLPTTAVLDAKGSLRYLLDPGDYRDTAQELRWVVDQELQRDATDKKAL